MSEFLTKISDHFLNTPGALLQLITSIVLFLVFYIFSRILRYKLAPWILRKVEAKGKQGFLIFLRGFIRPAPVFFWSFGLYLCLCTLPLPSSMVITFRPFLNTLLSVVLTALLAWGLIGASDVGPMLMSRFKGGRELGMDNTVITFVNRLLKGIVGTFAVLMILEELGAPVTSLITSLGIVGLTVSLAAKDYATNFLGGIIIIFEKPFAIGDYIQTSAGEGTVEDISFRSTVIRTLEDSLLTLPNHLLVDNPVTNFSRIERRLEKFTIGVTYDATHQQLEKLMESIRKELTQREDVWADSVQVRLAGFGDSSIDILIQYNAKTGSKPESLAIREKVNFQLMDLVAAAGCSFAFPSTSIYIEKK